MDVMTAIAEPAGPIGRVALQPTTQGIEPLQQQGDFHARMAASWLASAVQTLSTDRPLMAWLLPRNSMSEGTRSDVQRGSVGPKSEISGMANAAAMARGALSVLTTSAPRRIQAFSTPILGATRAATRGEAAPAALARARASSPGPARSPIFTSNLAARRWVSSVI